MPTPTTGTFRAIAGPVTLTGDANYTFVNAADMQECWRAISDIKYATPNLGGNVAKGAFASPDTSVITLNPGTVDEEIFEFNGLPSGFNVTAVSVKLRINIGIVSNSQHLKFRYNGAPVGSYISMLGAAFTFTHTVTPVPSTIATFFGTDFGFDYDGTGSAGIPVPYRIIAVYIEGTYELEQFAFTASPVDGSTVHIGDTITLTSPGTDPVTDLNLSQLSIVLDQGGVQTPIVPTSQTAILFVFDIPAGYPNGTTVVVAVGNGVQFSGQIALVTYSITPVDGSGIYTLVTDKSDDTIYDDTATGNSTIDVAILDPYGKIGFIGG